MTCTPEAEVQSVPAGSHPLPLRLRLVFPPFEDDIDVSNAASSDFRSRPQWPVNGPQKVHCEKSRVVEEIMDQMNLSCPFRLIQ